LVDTVKEENEVHIRATFLAFKTEEGVQPSSLNRAQIPANSRCLN
jgi:hypothetical protein